VRVSVCLAAYNGSRFIEPQISSILTQLDADDELIIVDDCSRDETCAIIERINDDRITLIKNKKNLGVNATFARAIAAASGDILFLSDQDDVWIEGRMRYMLAPFECTKTNVVAGNYSLIDGEGRSLPGTLAANLTADGGQHRARNIIGIFLGRMNYYGCAMAFRASLREMILPLPPRLECHDIWIALIGNLQRSIVHLPEPTLMHRIHGENASVIRRGLRVRLAARVDLGRQAILAKCRLNTSKSVKKIRPN
jgi:glycosyltransferase involved in cell wall biosynthesis